LPVTAADARLQALNAGADALGVPLTAGQAGALLAYADLIAQWNKVYNLTAVRDPADMLTHHLLDSLAVVAPLRRHLQGQGVEGQGGTGPVKLLDVGAGAGLPGVVIAICCPDVAVTCVDTVAKKAAFVQQVAAALKLPNLRGHHARVETLTAGDFDVVSARAFASLVDFTAWSGAALKPGREGDRSGAGVWLAMKGKHPADELAALPPGVEVFHVEQLTVPGLDAERCIVWMRKKLA
jgi:16S rRNA (guanine527-N7)-methyltransferase